MTQIRARKEFCLLAGDLNKLVVNDEFGVPGNHSEVSLGGKLLQQLLATGDLVLVNGLGADVVEGGPFTREDPATGVLSCLDLFVVSRELRPYIDKLIIDSKREISATRFIKRKGEFKVVHSDHFLAMLKFHNLQKKEVVEQKNVKWNLAKDGGWKKYKKDTEYCEKMGKNCGK